LPIASMSICWRSVSPILWLCPKYADRVFELNKAAAPTNSKQGAADRKSRTPLID
jgi:hypothetical protein